MEYSAEESQVLQYANVSFLLRLSEEEDSPGQQRSESSGDIRLHEGNRFGHVAWFQAGAGGEKEEGGEISHEHAGRPISIEATRCPCGEIERDEQRAERGSQLKFESHSRCVPVTGKGSRKICKDVQMLSRVGESGETGESRKLRRARSKGGCQAETSVKLFVHTL